MECIEVLRKRLQSSARPALLHLFISALFAVNVAAFVFLRWFPFPYADLVGGRQLFGLIVWVDVTCGPLLTLVLFTPKKSHQERLLDMILIVCLQLGALAYGFHTLWQVRPLYMVWEVDRFKVISQGELFAKDLQKLPGPLQVTWSDSPKVVGIRPARDAAEANQVLFEALEGGRDYAERPDFYVPLNAVGAERLLNKARKLEESVKLGLVSQSSVNTFAADRLIAVENLYILPVVSKSVWMAVLDVRGELVGYLPGEVVH